MSREAALKLLGLNDNANTRRNAELRLRTMAPGAPLKYKVAAKLLAA